MFPVSLTHLTFGYYFNNFNQPLEKGVLPPGLTHLKFGLLFRKPHGENVLPVGLKKLWYLDCRIVSTAQSWVLPDIIPNWVLPDKCVLSYF